MGSKPEFYIEASVEVPREQSDAVCNFIIENICAGLVLEDEEDSPVTGIKFYVAADDDRDFQKRLKSFLTGIGITTGSDIRRRTVENVEWEEEYKRQMKAVVIAGDVTVRPPWQDPPDGTRYDIIIEPKMAFGTGTHETTRSCLQVIRQTLKPGVRFLDMGCGSGVLSILADKMGAAYIKAIDYDIVAVENSRENFEINNVSTENAVRHGSLEQCDNDQPYDYVCVNIIKTAIMEMLPRLKKLVAAGGTLVLSGLLDRDLDDVLALMDQLRLNDYAIVEDNEWRTVRIFRT